MTQRGLVLDIFGGERGYLTYTRNRLGIDIEEDFEDIADIVIE